MFWAARELHNTKKTKSKQKAPKPRAARRIRTRPRKRRALGKGPPNDNVNTFIPNAINNKATSPKKSQSGFYSGVESIATVKFPENAAVGQIIYNEQISHELVTRLFILSMVYQYVKWIKCHLKLVSLNGSTITSGYTVGFVEDPEAVVPTNPKDTISYLTALRGTSTRQNWVSADIGQIVDINSLPKMYTTKGTDPRRFYIGRFVIALNGNPGQQENTFHIMLDYEVRLSVPCAKPLPSILGDFTFDANAFPGSVKLTGALVNEINSVGVTYTGSMPSPGVYSIPNTTLLLKNNIVNFGWNETDEGVNKLYYKDWPKDYIDNSKLYIISHLVVPVGATSLDQCGFRETLNGPTILFSSLREPKGTLTSTSDEDTSGLDLVMEAGLSWLTPPIAFDNIQFATETGVVPAGFASIAKYQGTPFILSGTSIRRVSGPPTLTELKLMNLEAKLAKLGV